MKRSVGQLVDVMQELVDETRALLSTSRRKCTALANMSLDLIRRTSTDEETHAGRIQGLDRRRRDIVLSILGDAEDAGDMPGRAMDRLINKLEENDRARVAVLRRELALIMKDLQQVNITNNLVSRRSLRHFKELLGLISRGGAVEPTYARPGKTSTDWVRTGLVDHTA